MSENMEQSDLIPSLPYDVTVDIVARVPRSHYPTLSLVSRSFRKLIASPTLYETRSELGITQHRIYAVIRKPDTDDYSFYILHKKLNCSNRLVAVGSPLSLESYRVSCVPVGSKVYVFNDLSALSFDCTSHTVQPISDIPQQMRSKVANVIDGKKIYVMGYSLFHKVMNDVEWDVWRNSVSVFDIETKLWEPKLVNEPLYNGVWSDSVVMEGQIYIRGCRKDTSFIYDPEKRKGEIMDEMMSSKEWQGACVVDDVLYYHDMFENVLRAYDPKLNCWSLVNGLEEFLAVETAHSWRSRTVNYGAKKLALFFHKTDDYNVVIFCAEIALERRQSGEIWGKMESCDVAIEDMLYNSLKFVCVIF